MADAPGLEREAARSASVIAAPSANVADFMAIASAMSPGKHREDVLHRAFEMVRLQLEREYEHKLKRLYEREQIAAMRREISRKDLLIEHATEELRVEERKRKADELKKLISERIFAERWHSAETRVCWLLQFVRLR